MNPVLLKPTGERSSQVIVLGRPVGEQEAAGYYATKEWLVEVVDGALDSLRRRFDVVVCEGAGSPAEINLLEHDIVNLGLAARAGIPAVLVGDIERGGVFAHLFGTVAILPDDLARSRRRFRDQPVPGRSGPARERTIPTGSQDRCAHPRRAAVPVRTRVRRGGRVGRRPDVGRRAGGRPRRGGRPVAAALELHRPRPLVAEPGVHVRWVAGPWRSGAARSGRSARDPLHRLRPGVPARAGAGRGDRGAAGRPVATRDPRSLRRVPDAGLGHRRSAAGRVSRSRHRAGLAPGAHGVRPRQADPPGACRRRRVRRTRRRL